jgi:N6-adenosine-specific RNA methylase IME4
VEGSVKIGTFETHPAADAFPMMDDAALSDLVEDIKRNGLEHPVVYITEGKRQLILDGRNRLRACIQAKVKAEFTAYRGKDPIGYVVSLNLRRRHLDESQRAMVAARLSNLDQGRPAKTGTSAGLSQGEAATMLNVGDRTVRSARAVLERAVPEVVKAVDEGRMKVTAAAELADRPKDEQRAIAARAGKEIRTGHVRAMIRQNQRRETVEKINRDEVTPLPIGPFRVILADVPWPYENSDGHLGSRGHITYPPMSIDEICRLVTDIDKLAHHDCVLGFWSTNLFMKDTPRVIEAWKFDWVSMSTWTKNKAGTGIAGPRGRTEHLVWAMRGKPIHTLNEISTWLGDRVLDVREHSRKPELAYEVIEKHCPGAKLEMFARDPREGWARWGAETELFAKGAA